MSNPDEYCFHYADSIIDDLVKLCPDIDFNIARVIKCQRDRIVIPILDGYETVPIWTEDTYRYGMGFRTIELWPKETSDPRYLVDTYKDDRYQIVAFRMTYDTD